MGDRHGTALGYLLTEKRDDRSVTSQYVTETDCHKLRIILVIKCLYDHLADALGSTHDIGRVNRLIRTDHDEPAGPAHGCSLSYMEGTEHIVLDGLSGAVLHQRHMLMRCCMVDDSRVIFIKYPVHTIGITYAGDQHLQIQLGMVEQKLLLYLIYTVLVDIQHDQLGGMMCGDLAAQLRSYGSSRACYQYNLILDIAKYRIQIYLYRITSEQILYLDVTEL